MKLYHGSTVIVKYPNIQKGRKATDFGKGFYTTMNLEQAKKWAILKKNRENSQKAVVSVYDVPDDMLDREFSIFRFEGVTKEWLEFVVHNRKGKGSENYDLTMGPVANDQLTPQSDFTNKALSRLPLPLKCSKRTNYLINSRFIP